MIVYDMSTIFDHGLREQLKLRREQRGEYSGVSLERLAGVLNEKLRKLEFFWSATGERYSDEIRARIAKIRETRILPELGPHIVASLDSAVDAVYTIEDVRSGSLMGWQPVSLGQPYFFLDYMGDRIGDGTSKMVQANPIHIFGFTVSDGYPNDIPGIDKPVPKIDGPLPLGKTKVVYEIRNGLPTLEIKTEESLRARLVLAYQAPKILR